MTELIKTLVPDLQDVERRGPFAPGEITTVTCGRCQDQRLPWELRTFGDKAICKNCFDATLELARAAIKVMPANEPNRLCRNCRAMSDPSVGSAWCEVTELTDERARICANFVPTHMELQRAQMTAGRTAAIDVWHAVSRELKDILGEEHYRTWFGDIEAVEWRATSLVLEVPDAHTRDWLQNRLMPVLLNAFSVAGYPHATVEFTLDPVPEQPAHIEDEKQQLSKAGFNPHYTFAEFIVGSANRLAHASALAAVDQPGLAYNPLVLYGGVGVGKTHLLQAIGQEVIDQGRHNVLYTTSETFTNELIAAIRSGSTNEFRQRYRGVDVLLLDDIQFIAGKEATQEEFFHTFNALHQAGKQIVVTSDRPPSDLRVLQDRLRSRFAWGLIADMQSPDLETRIAIVRSKADLRGRRLHETVVNALAVRVGSNVRELEGALNRILALADLIGTEPSMDTIRAVLGDPALETGVCMPEDVLQAVSSYYKIKASELTGTQRERSIAYARQMAMFLLREEAKLSLVAVGNHLGGRNHSTVLYGCDRITKESRRKGRVREDVQALKLLIYGSI